MRHERQNSNPHESKLIDSCAPRVRCGTAGFTLIEVLLVVVVFGILTGIVTPQLVSVLGKTKTRSAASRFVSAHALARATAIRFGRVAELHIDAAGRRFWIEVDTSQAGGVMDTVGLVHRTNEANLVMTSNRSLLCFDNRGLATDRGACEAGDVLVSFTLGGDADSVRTGVVGKVLR